MIDLKNIEIIFENCETMTIPKNCIGEFHIGKIRTEINRIACNSIAKYQIADSFYIEIYNTCNIEYKPFGFDENMKKFDRLNAYNDITGIDVFYTDGTCDSFSVNYEEETPDMLGSPNIHQKTYMSELGHLYIVIEEGIGVKDVFDLEMINNKESVEFDMRMRNIGIEEMEIESLLPEKMPDYYKYVYLYDKNDCSKLAIRIPNDIILNEENIKEIDGNKWILNNDFDENGYYRGKSYDEVTIKNLSM